jgi:alpha-tubulin suppressor-like RCC1 family protein
MKTRQLVIRAGLVMATGVAITTAAGVTVPAIVAGAEDTFVLKADGTVWAWGFNSWGQLGDGTTNEQHQAIQVTNVNAGSGVLIKSAQLIQLTNAVLGFKSCPGCVHFLQQRANSVFGSWQTVQTNIAGTGATLRLTNAVPSSASSHCYRIGAAVP